jgi:serine/threonine protein phosphatase 1
LDSREHTPQSAGEPGSVALGRSVFEVLPGGRLNWAVASIHGEVDRLRALHDRLGRRIRPEDNLVYLGNFLGRGGDVAGTVEELLLFRRALLARQTFDGAGAIAYLRGRQEEMWQKLLQVHFAPNPREVLEWMMGHGLGPTLAAYGGLIEEGRRAAASGAAAMSHWTNRLRAAVRARDGHDRLISVVRRAAFTTDQALLFVNAGIDIDRPLSEQSDSFWWGGADFDDVDQPYSGFQKVVRGFDYRHRGAWIKRWVASIDSGCGFGGTLTAACFDPLGRSIEIIEV